MPAGGSSSGSRATESSAVGRRIGWDGRRRSSGRQWIGVPAHRLVWVDGHRPDGERQQDLRERLPRHPRSQSRHRRSGVLGARRPVGLRQVDGAAHGGRARDDHRRRDEDRRPRRQRRAAEGPRHRHGLPELRAVPAHDRGRQHRVRAEAGPGAQGRDQAARDARRRTSSSSSSTSTASRASCRVASASAWRWVERSCASRRRSSWTSRCRTSTPSCACRCAPRSPACSATSVSPPSTSPTTRSRR